MSGTVNYPKVIDHLTDVIKELNVPCGAAVEPPAAEPSAAERQADAAALLRVLLNKLEPHGADARAAAAAEHSATADERYRTDGGRDRAGGHDQARAQARARARACVDA